MTHRQKFEWTDVDHASLLIQASTAFPRLEELVFSAEREVLLAFRVFDAQTALRSKHKSPDLQNWGDLIAHKARQGISVRLLLADFEPVLVPSLHQENWASVLAFLKKTQSVETFEVICAQHGAQFSPLMRAVFWPYFVKKIRDLRQSVTSGDMDIHTAPGLRQYFHPSGKLKLRSLFHPAAMRPATYHQKLAVIDGKAAVVGGLDVDERRYDTATHNRPAKDTWHDVSVFVKGRAARDLRAHFESCWNEEIDRPAPHDRLKRLCADHDLKPPVAHPITPDSQSVEPQPDSVPARVIRTLSKNARGIAAIRPRTTHDEIFQETLEIVAAAKQSLYIETQFFRSLPLAKALAKRARAQQDLVCIILLPFAPEEVAFDKHHHRAHRHGEWLQGRCLKLLKHAFGERLGIFSLAKPEEAKNETGRAQEYDAGVIHLHSKLLLADDKRLTITSANLNGRSLKWDTEVGLSFKDEAFTRSVRTSLWCQHLQRESVEPWGPRESLDHWKAVALANVNRQPRDRQGFVLPHRSAKTIKYGRPAFFIPNEMV